MRLGPVDIQLPAGHGQQQQAGQAHGQRPGDPAARLHKGGVGPGRNEDAGQFHALERVKLEYLGDLLGPLAAFLEHVGQPGGALDALGFLLAHLHGPGLALGAQALFPDGELLAVRLPDGALAVPHLAPLGPLGVPVGLGGPQVAGELFHADFQILQLRRVVAAVLALAEQLGQGFLHGLLGIGQLGLQPGRFVGQVGFLHGKQVGLAAGLVALGAQGVYAALEVHHLGLGALQQFPQQGDLARVVLFLGLQDLAGLLQVQGRGHFFVEGFFAGLLVMLFYLAQVGPGLFQLGAQVAQLRVLAGQQGLPVALGLGKILAQEAHGLHVGLPDVGRQRGGVGRVLAARHFLPEVV